MKTHVVALAVAAMLVARVAAQAPDRLGRIDRLFQQFVDDNRIAGAVVLVLRDSKPVYDKAFGWADKEAGRKMTTDTIFRIASQSKAITSAAIMSLVEEGKIAINNPASRYIPGFAKTMVAVAGEGDVKIVPARRQIGTLHSSSGLGFGYGFQTTDRYGANGMESVGSFGWGGSVRYDVPHRSESPHGHRDDDSDAAEHERHRGALQRDSVSIAARRANQMTEWS